MIRGSLLFLALASLVAMNGCTKCGNHADESAPAAEAPAATPDAMAPAATPDAAAPADMNSAPADANGTGGAEAPAATPQ
jgi:hypothetical protein